MTPITEWFGSRHTPVDSVRAALAETVARVRPERVSSGARGFESSVVLDDGTGSFSTIRIHDGRLSVAEGRDPRAEAVISGDPLTLVGIIRGKRSGLDAFLRGRLRVRGNVSLALKLEGIFERRSRHTNRARPRRVVAGGIDTFFLDAGSGPPVILLHGLGATNASMLPTIAALAGRYRVLAPDLPGSGDSDKPFAAYDAPFFAGWLSAFLDATGIDRAHLVGNSMGGRIALELALESPNRVASLSLLSPSLAFRKFRQAVPLVRFMLPEMGAIPLPILQAHVERAIKLLFARPERLYDAWYRAAADEFVRVFRTPRGRVAFFAAARQIYLEPPFGPRGFWTRLARLTVPALFVWGAADRMVPPGFARHVEALLPRAKSVVLPECGHIPQFELPSTTHGLVREFLAAAASEAKSRARTSVPPCSDMETHAPESARK